MKHILSLLLLSLPFLSKGQEAEKKFQLGFTLSPNIGWLKFADSNSSFSSDGVRAGISYGVLADLGFAKNYYFSTGFTLTTINGIIASTIKTGPEEKVKVNYIEVPLTLKLKSTSAEQHRFYGQFGLGLGVNITPRREFAEEAIQTDAQTFRLGLITGGGAEWTISRNLNLLTGVTWNNGFTEVFGKSYNSRNSYLALNLGLYF